MNRRNFLKTAAALASLGVVGFSTDDPELEPPQTPLSIGIGGVVREQYAPVPADEQPFLPYYAHPYAVWSSADSPPRPRSVDIPHGSLDWKVISWGEDD